MKPHIYKSGRHWFCGYKLSGRFDPCDYGLGFGSDPWSAYCAWAIDHLT